MRYTVKDKSKYTFVFFLIALTIYALYIFYDYSNQGNWWRKEFGFKKQEDITKISPNALLLGGSNVAYSLSANQLSDMTEYSWFNLGLSSGAFNDVNYWGFVSSSLNENQRLEVKLVVYSGIALFRNGYLKSRANDDSDPWGNRKLSWIPNKPLAVLFRNLWKKGDVDLEQKYPLPIDRGDFDFDKKQCIPKYQESFEREMDWAQVQSWFDVNISTIAEKFPYASVIFVTPSEYYGDTYDRNTDISYTNKLRTLLESKFSSSNVGFLAQPPYAEKSMTCDGRHHANSVGRTWRTEHLSNFINARIDQE